MKAKPPSQGSNSGISDAKRPAEDLDAEFSDFECSQLFQQALNGDRTSALVMWRQVAEGRRDQETRLWTISIAKRILEADQDVDANKDDGARRRPDKLMAAISLTGREDLNRRIRELVRALDGFVNLETGKKPRLTRQIISMLREEKLVREDQTDDEVRRIIDRHRGKTSTSPDKSM